MFDVDYSAGVIPGTTGQLDVDMPGGAGSAGVTLGTGTGQHGTQPLEGSMMNSNPIVAAWNWLNEPFKTPMAPSSIFLLVGVVLIAILLWNLILFHVRIAAESL